MPIPTPMPPATQLTFGALKDMLAEFAGVEDTARFPDTARGLCINMAIRRLCRLYETTLNATSDSITTTPGTEALALDATCSRIYKAYTLDAAGAETKLTYYPTEEEFRKIYPRGTAAGEPKAYYLWGGNMILGPTPSTAITVHRLFWAILADLSSPTDRNAFIDRAWEAVLFTALADFAPLYLIEDARIPVWKGQARDLVADFVSEQARMVITPGGMAMETPG